MEFSQRRDKLLAEMGQGLMLIPAASTAVRNNDVDHDFRQDSDFYYLTGFEEAQSLVLLSNCHGSTRFVMFMQPSDEKTAIWDGQRLGVDDAISALGADEAYDIAELDRRLPEFLKNVPTLYYELGKNDGMDRSVVNALAQVKRQARTGVVAPTNIVDPTVVLHEMRMVKSAEEVALMKMANEISASAHVQAMRQTKPGMFEYEIEALLLAEFRRRGSRRVAYGSIVGSGQNATILHYRNNNRQMESGQLLLIDAGCELDYYASDITRTFPVNGKFSSEQRALYDIVLRAQHAAIDSVKPGATLDDVHGAAVGVLCEGLVDVGLINGPVRLAIEEKKYTPFYMHRTSHWLGMDVHDVGAYYVDGSPRPLQPGYVLTVEPGLYVRAQADVDEKWRGIGIRIEDDILVTRQGCENLSTAAPKEVEQIEAICSR